MFRLILTDERGKGKRQLTDFTVDFRGFFGIVPNMEKKIFVFFPDSVYNKTVSFAHIAG